MKNHKKKKEDTPKHRPQNQNLIDSKMKWKIGGVVALLVVLTYGKVILALIPLSAIAWTAGKICKHYEEEGR